LYGKILVVDDDMKIQDILRHTLADEGHLVHVASDGQQALEYYERYMPDLVILDIALPDMDGRHVWQKIRSIDNGMNVPVLFLSASSDIDTRISTLDGGAEDFIVKPFSLREVIAKVRRVLLVRNRTRVLEEKQEELESEVTEGKQNVAQVNRELKRQLLSMKTLFTVTQDLNRRLDLDELINRFALTLVGELQLSSMAVFVVERKEDKFTLHGLKGFDKKRISDLTISSTSRFAKWLGKQPRPQKLVRRRGKQLINRLPDVRLAIFEYVTPIIVKQQLAGVVFTGPKISGREYTAFERDMLQSICNSAGIGIDNSRLFHELQNTYLSTVKALVSLIEAKDPYTKGHTERVADYSVALGKRLDLSKDDIRDIAFGAVLHDIGKLIIYERILNKPGTLDKEEWEVLKKHPEVGAAIIENMEFLSGAIAHVKHHHEKWDGTGYPAGLEGTNIPLGARIIAVSDSFDAMTTDRSYRKALTWEQAKTELLTNAGTQFDPDVVNAFIALIEKDGFRTRIREKEPAKTTSDK